MVVKVYYSEISGSKEVKKRQQRVMMILDSKSIPYEAVDITEPGKESSKDFMLSNAKPRGDTKIILSPQIFSGDLYCGDYDAFDLANENDTLEEFLGTPKIEKVFTNGKSKSASREPSENREQPSNGNVEEPVVVAGDLADISEAAPTDSSVPEVTDNSAPDEPNDEEAEEDE